MKKAIAGFVLLVLALPALFGSARASESLSGFAAEFTAHADNLEESFVISCSKELQDLLFSDSCIPGQSLITEIKANAGMLSYSYYRHPDSLEFVGCRYYEGKRIVHAWRNRTTGTLTDREQQTLAAAQSLVAGIAGTDLEREKAVHDLLCRTVTYSTHSGEGHFESDCAVGALLGGRADCDGYTDAFYLLGSLAGLEVRYQHGKAVPSKDSGRDNHIVLNTESTGHMWNLVRIQGQWAMTDVTWDDQEDGICYFYFNTGTAEDAQKHLWEPRVLLVSPVSAASGEFRPAGLEYLNVSDWDGLYSTLRATVGKRDRICLRYPETFDLQKNWEQAANALFSLGVQQYYRTYGTNCVEITHLELHPCYRVCETKDAALAFLEECASAGVREFAIYFTPKLSPSMFANDRAAIADLLGRSRLDSPAYKYREEYRMIAVENAAWLAASVRSVSGLSDLLAYLDLRLGAQDTEVLCVLPASMDFSSVRETVQIRMLRLGVDNFSWFLNGPRLTISNITYYPEYKIVSTRREIINYVSDCRSRRVRSFRIYCTEALYRQLSRDSGIFSVLKDAGLKTDRLKSSDTSLSFILENVDW